MKNGLLVKAGPVWKRECVHGPARDTATTTTTAKDMYGNVRMSEKVYPGT